MALGILQGRGKYHLFHSHFAPTDSNRQCVFYDLAMGFWNPAEHCTPHGRPSVKTWLSLPDPCKSILNQALLLPGFVSFSVPETPGLLMSQTPSVVSPYDLPCFYGLFSFGRHLMFRALQSMTWTFSKNWSHPSPWALNWTLRYWAGVLPGLSHHGFMQSPQVEETGLAHPTNSTVITFNPVNWPFGWTIATVRSWGREAA